VHDIGVIHGAETRRDESDRSCAALNAGDGQLASVGVGGGGGLKQTQRIWRRSPSGCW
jgi:hypothetical protein